jgi:hypothetical protein
VFLGLYGLGVNSDFNYDRYFAMIPSGPEPKTSFTKGFFDTAMAQNPKPTTVAIVAADAEFSKNASDGARENAKKAGLKIVYDKSYPPSTTDFGPIVRGIQATNPDLVVICSYPLDSVGMVLAANEAKLNPKMIGGAMVGLQSTVFKTKLGPALNGYMNYDFWLPAKSLMFEGTENFLQKYQDRAAKRASIRSATTWRRSATPIWTSSDRRSRRPKASTMPSLPSTCARTRSRPLSATYRSARTANGRSHGSFRRNSAGSRAMASTSSRTWTP